mmetsp:Transcript_25585/g.30316  ORF Transcript_25585/g.30316 Transcript_25585/m.30316 type:complete len:232 (-) Transcript_25585:250-945(-)
MLSQSRVNLAAYINKEVIKIRNKELELYHHSLTEKGIGLISALIAELAFFALMKGSFREWSFTSRNPLYRHHEEHVYDMTKEQSANHYYLSAALAICLIFAFTAALNSVVVCGCAIVYGPSLALRGLELSDMERAVDGMLIERRNAFRLAIVATMSLLFAAIPAILMRLNTTRYKVNPLEHDDDGKEEESSYQGEGMSIAGIWLISVIPILGIVLVSRFGIFKVQKKFKLK